MGRVDGKVAIITGAASGMGLSGAQIFAREGAKVVMTDVAEEKLKAGAAAIEAEGGAVLALTHDVSSADAWDEVVAKTLEAFGRIDILVNNAGIHVAKGMLETDQPLWDRVTGINEDGVWLGMKAVVPHIQEIGGGAIVNVASIAGLFGGPGNDGGGAAYSASKGAVLALTRHAAQAYAADSIRVNAICPGGVYTGMVAEMGFPTKEAAVAAMGATEGTPLPPHMGDPEDIGYAMLFLASEESKFVTGQHLVVDGGATSK